MNDYATTAGFPVATAMSRLCPECSEHLYVHPLLCRHESCVPSQPGTRYELGRCCDATMVNRSAVPIYMCCGKESDSELRYFPVLGTSTASLWFRHRSSPADGQITEGSGVKDRGGQ